MVKKIGTIPINDGGDEVKQTNEITMVDPLLATLETEGKNFTFDALHTQKKTASMIVEKYGAHYFFTVKGNQPTLLDDIRFHFNSGAEKPEAEDIEPGTHGRIETRQIWTTTELNDYLTFPYRYRCGYHGYFYRAGSGRVMDSNIDVSGNSTRRGSIDLYFYADRGERDWIAHLSIFRNGRR